MAITPAALREIRALQTECDALLKLPNLTKSDAKRADLLLAKLSNIRHAGQSSDEMRRAVANEMLRETGQSPVDFDAETPETRAHQRIFSSFLCGAEDSTIQSEIRNTLLTVGQQTPVFTTGLQGGVLVPMKFSQIVTESRAQIDPLFDENVVSLIQETGYTLPPMTIPGFDLTGIAATKVAESAQHGADVVPNIDSRLMNRFTYRLTLAGTFESSGDVAAYGGAENALARAIGTGMARGIGVDLISGDGATAPQGALTGAVDSGVLTGAAGKLSLTDFTGLFYSFNSAYRNSPKFAWLMADSTHQMAANAVDGNGRPLFPVEDGVLKIMGKPALISPSMPGAAGSKGILAGDFSAYFVHSSTLFIRRRLQYPGLVEYGKFAMTALQMVDALVFDATDGANSGAYSPIKYATLHG